MSTHKFDLDPKEQETWDSLSDFLAQNSGHRMQVEVKIINDQRTPPQNNAIHLYARLLSEALNDAGLHMVRTLEMLKAKDLDIDWTPEQVKERIWRPVQIAVTEKQSSADLTRSEVSTVYETLNRHLANAGIPTIPFPDRWGR